MKVQKKYFIYLIVLSYICFPLEAIMGQESTINIQADILGIDGRKLVWLKDFDIELRANGELLGPEDYIIEEFSERSLTSSINKKGIASVSVKLIFRDYQEYIKNIKIVSEKNGYDLMKITPTPNELMIAKIKYEETSDQEDDYMDFEVTFRNNSQEKIFVRKLSIDTKAEISCFSPDPVFARVTVDNKIGYLSPKNETDFSGSFENSDRVNEDVLMGKIIYNDCGEQSISLDLDLSFIVPEDKFSKMLIRIPNELNFYNHELSDSAKPTKISIDRPDKDDDLIKSMFSLIQRIPQVKFEFSIEGNKQSKVHSVINDFY